MNSNDAREAICLTLEALTPATLIRASDKYRRSENLAIGDGSRAFEVELEVPPYPTMENAGGFNSIADPMVVEFILSVMYASGDRAMMAQDMDQIVGALRSLPAESVNQVTYSKQIRSVIVAGESIDGAGDPRQAVEFFRIPRWRVTVYYDSRSA